MSANSNYIMYNLYINKEDDIYITNTVIKIIIMSPTAIRLVVHIC